MELISCPECGTRVSSQATSCPYCGFSANASGEIVPIGSLPPSHLPAKVNFPELAVFDDGSDIVPVEEKAKLASLLKNADLMAKLAPGVYDAIQQAMQKRGEVWAATFSRAAEKMMENGELVLAVEKETGAFLPQLVSKKTGRVYEKARLKAADVPDDLASSLASLQTQMMVAEVMNEIKSIAASVEQLRIEGRADRMAKAQSVWARLESSMQITNSRLREQALLAIAQDATELRHVFQYNFEVRLGFSFGKEGKVADRGLAAQDALVNLSVLSLMARSECAAYSLLGENDAATAALAQFGKFIEQNRLSDRDTLLRINSRSKANLEPLATKFLSISNNITALEEGASKSYLPEEAVPDEEESES